MKRELHSNTSSNSNYSSIFIYESELDYISRCILDYPNIETGGNLFGSFTRHGVPIVEYVIGPGKTAIHRATEFRQEKEYLSKVYEHISTSLALSEIGAWHSHHQLDLPHPSGGDIRTVLNGLKKANLEEFIIVIGSFSPPETLINAFTFKNNPTTPYRSAEWKILKGVSPFRERIDKEIDDILLHPNTEAGSYKEKHYHVFEKQHWLSDKENIEEVKKLVNFIKQKIETVKVFHLEDNIVLDIQSDVRNINIIFPESFPSDPSFLVVISDKEGELISEVESTIENDKGISSSIIQYLENQNIL